jgi:hypothetical protein
VVIERLLDFTLDGDAAAANEVFFAAIRGGFCRADGIPDEVENEVVLLNANFLSGSVVVKVDVRSKRLDSRLSDGFVAVMERTDAMPIILRTR